MTNFDGPMGKGAEPADVNSAPESLVGDGTTAAGSVVGDLRNLTTQAFTGDERLGALRNSSPTTLADGKLSKTLFLDAYEKHWAAVKNLFTFLDVI